MTRRRKTAARPSPLAASDPAHVERVLSREVQDAALRGLRSQGLRGEVLRELLARVSEELLRSTRRPADEAGYRGMAYGLGRWRAIDHLRRLYREGQVGLRQRERKRDAASRAADAEALSALRQRMAEVMAALRAAGVVTARQERMHKMQARGMSAAQIGRKLGLAPGTVLNELSASRQAARRAWKDRQ